jgi:hypothetical protein
MADGIGEAWRDAAGVRELAGQVSAVTACLAVQPDALSGEEVTRLLQVRLQAVYLLNTLGDSTGLAVLAAEPLAADCERLLGADHPATLGSRNNLAMVYWDTGRTAEAIPLYERTLADAERVLGADHPNMLLSRNNLAMAYQDAGGAAGVAPWRRLWGLRRRPSP